jgi:hypothetical protein
MEGPGKMDKILGDFWKDLESRVEALLRAHCGKLIKLADSLLKRSSLSRNDVLSILEPGPTALGEGGKDPETAPVPSPSCSELDLVAAQ